MASIEPQQYDELIKLATDLAKRFLRWKRKNQQNDG
ncbi:hypothetical protein MnTg02_01663 [bacterium MnTg02]|nr:hypothetical protein MnTg02_01663 [bacterium MnTg02]